MFGLGPGELLIVLAIVVLLFGSTRIPALAESLGKSIRLFKRGARGDEIDVTPKKDEIPPKGGANPPPTA